MVLSETKTLHDPHKRESDRDRKTVAAEGLEYGGAGYKGGIRIF